MYPPDLPPCKEHTLIGSTALYGSGADVDLLCLYEFPLCEEGLGLQGWIADCPMRYGNTPEFRSFRKGGTNLIAYYCASGYHGKVAGFLACQYLVARGLLSQSNKAGRVAIHECCSAAAERAL